MKEISFQISTTAWCPGCGNFGIIQAMRNALQELEKKTHEVLLVGGIGQAAKLPQYLSANGLCSLHGRALPGATGAKVANTELDVLISSGDGDCYGEGGNHLLHTIRRNIDLTLVVHNNQVYGLTQGQSSPTSDESFVTRTQPDGVTSRPLRGPALAIALGCGFVARSFSGDVDHLTEIIKHGVQYRGFSFIEVLQPCVSMNKQNTFAWYKKRVYRVNDDTDYDTGNRIAAFEIAEQWGDSIPIGIFYRQEGSTFEEKFPQLAAGPLVKRPPRSIELLESLMNRFI